MVTHVNNLTDGTKLTKRSSHVVNQRNACPTKWNIIPGNVLKTTKVKLSRGTWKVKQYQVNNLGSLLQDLHRINVLGINEPQCGT